MQSNFVEIVFELKLGPRYFKTLNLNLKYNEDISLILKEPIDGNPKLLFFIMYVY